MFIYKIEANNKVYIGFDTKEPYKKSRWKTHCRLASFENPKLKVHKEMKLAGIENCTYDVIISNVPSMIELALLEIEYIKKYDSFKNGLNSSAGGDGLSYKDLTNMSLEDIQKIKDSLSESFRDYNISKKWADKTFEERKKLTSHLHTSEVQEKKSNSLKNYYEYYPEEKEKRKKAIRQWQEQNREQMLVQNKINFAKASEKNSIKIKATDVLGNVTIFKSKTEFKMSTGVNPSTALLYTKKNMFYKGYKIEEI